MMLGNAGESWLTIQLCVTAVGEAVSSCTNPTAAWVTMANPTAAWEMWTRGSAEPSWTCSLCPAQLWRHPRAQLPPHGVRTHFQSIVDTSNILWSSSLVRRQVIPIKSKTKVFVFQWNLMQSLSRQCKQYTGTELTLCLWGMKQIFLEILQKLVISNCQILVVKMLIRYFYNYARCHSQSSILLQNQILDPKSNCF